MYILLNIFLYIHLLLRVCHKHNGPLGACAGPFASLLVLLRAVEWMFCAHWVAFMCAGIGCEAWLVGPAPRHFPPPRKTTFFEARQIGACAEALGSSGGPPHGYPAHTNGGVMLFRSQQTRAVHWCIVGSHEIPRFTRKSQFTPYGHMM